MFEELVLKELVRNGYSKENGKRIWNIANHRLLYSTPQLAQGFLDLERFPRYKANVVDRELGLLKKHVPSFYSGSRDTFNVVDLGCGDGMKAEIFLKSLPKSVKIHYYPYDVSLPLVHLAKTRIRRARIKGVSVKGSFIEDFSMLDRVMKRVRKTSPHRTIFLLMGSTLGSFEVNDFLFSLRKQMKYGDMLAIGNGIRTGKRFVALEKYRNPLFNAWFTHLMHGLGFSPEEVSYDVRFAHGRLEFFYRIKRDKVFVSRWRRIKFKAGDEITVAVQYKYYAHELERFCKMYFSDVRFFNDKDEEYALVFCVK